jgi:hypothetical protein
MLLLSRFACRLLLGRRRRGGLLLPALLLLRLALCERGGRLPLDRFLPLERQRARCLLPLEARFSTVFSGELSPVGY